MRMLNSDLRWYRDRLIALSVCALVALMLAFGLVPRGAAAATFDGTAFDSTYPDPPNSAAGTGADGTPNVAHDTCTHLASVVGQTERVFWPGITIPASSSTVVHPGDLVGAWYSDETVVNPGVIDPTKRIHFQLWSSTDGGSTYTNPVADYLPATISEFIDNRGTGLDNDGQHHPFLNDFHRECYFQEMITTNIPSVTASGHYRMTLTAYDSDGASTGRDTSGDFGTAQWDFNVKASLSVKTQASGPVVVGNPIHDTASVTGGDSPTGSVTFNLYAPGDLSCQSAPVFTDTKALGVASGNYTTAAVGIYRWTATYNGDDNNLTATSGCQDEQVTVVAAEQVAAAAAAAAAQQVQAAAVTLPKAGAGPQQQGSSAPGGGGPFGASGIVATLLLALIGSVLFALGRRESAAAEEPKA